MKYSASVVFLNATSVFKYLGITLYAVKTKVRPRGDDLKSPSNHFLVQIKDISLLDTKCLVFENKRSFTVTP